MKKHKLYISPKILPSIAGLYTEPNRVFMEYIDNSLDSAADYYIVEEGDYSRKILIQVKKKGKNYRNYKISFIDNCKGMDTENLLRIIKEVGNSNKKAQTWTNGQFGFGVYAFLAVCSKITFITKEKGENPIKIEISEDKIVSDSEHYFPDPKILKPKKFPFESGTIVTLSKFKKDACKVIDLNELKSEIEKHFELFLNRKKLEVELEDELKEGDLIYKEKLKKYTCQPFNYSQFPGEEFPYEIKELIYIKGTTHKTKNKLFLKIPVKIYLKYTSGVEVNKRPIFISKGRRIDEVKNIKSFMLKSHVKGRFWDHPNITGYIDVGNLLEPILSRQDFKNTKEKRALFEQLADCEILFEDLLKQENERIETKHYKKLENELSKVLSKLLKDETLKFKSESFHGDEEDIKMGSLGKDTDGLGGREDRTEGDAGEGTGTGLGTDDGDGKGAGSDNGILPSDIPGGDAPFESNDDGSSGTGKKRRKKGFDIRIVDDDPDIDNLTTKPMRSRFVDGVIEIFRKHSDFEERVSKKRDGKSKISQRLITYLAGEISTYYKDKLITNKAENITYDYKILSDLVEFLYKFENSLQYLVGKNLSSDKPLEGELKRD